MPTYEYRCAACGHQFEKFQSITAAPINRCPQCGKKKVQRLIGTGAGLIFKGSGFYITDYRDSSYKDKAKAESGNAAGSSGTDNKSSSTESPKPESKPAAAESKPAPKSKSDPKPNSTKKT